MRLALLALWVLALTACDPGEDVDPADATAALEAQRDDVRGLVATLTAEAASALGGRRAVATGHWEGCASVFPEGHRSFRYRASSRVEAGPGAPRPYLDTLVTVLVGAGMADPTPGERPGGRTLGGTLRGVEVRFSEFAGRGDYVLLDGSGPCVDVPADQRDAWEGRVDPEPIIE